MATLSAFVPLALLLRLLLLLLLLFDRLSISLLLLIGDGTCWWWLCCGCCSWCKLLWLFCWWLLFVTWIENSNNKKRSHFQICTPLHCHKCVKFTSHASELWTVTFMVGLHEILGNELVNDGAWNFAEYKAKYVVVVETLFEQKTQHFDYFTTIKAINNKRNKYIVQFTKWERKIKYASRQFTGIHRNGIDWIGLCSQWEKNRLRILNWMHTKELTVWQKKCIQIVCQKLNHSMRVGVWIKYMKWSVISRMNAMRSN